MLHEQKIVLTNEIVLAYYYKTLYLPTLVIFMPAAIIHSEAIVKFETDRGSFPDKNIYRTLA